MKPLPISKQSFRSMREYGFLYVDKTEHLWRMAHLPKQYFYSRPRRFGKSVTLETLKELFLGSRHLFEGLWIYDRWDWSKKYPVIHIAFNKIGYLEIGLENAITQVLKGIAGKHGLSLENETPGLLFEELIQKLHDSQGAVVVLIDEYDKPMIDYLNKENLHQAKENQKTLKAFYSVLKGSEDMLRFLFITGVSKFSKVSVFSDLNHLSDLTMHPAYAAMTGYTQPELEHYFEEYLAQQQANSGQTREQLLASLCLWYDGYTWDAKTHVYNPFSILSFFDQGIFTNFWFQTGTPTFLIRLLKERLYFDFDNVKADDSIFESYELDKLDTVPLLFQTGYLTIKEMDAEFGTYVLGYPNREVKESMLRHLFGAFSHREASGSTGVIQDLAKALRRHDLDETMRLFNNLFQAIPKDIFIAHSEAYFHSVIYLTFLYLGLFVEAETHSGNGHLDAAVTLADRIYIFEFKLDKTAEYALSRLKAKDYAARFRLKGLDIIGVGVRCSSKKRLLSDWKEEKV